MSDYFSKSEIKTGFSVINLVADDMRLKSIPIGVAAWDSDSEWYGVRFPQKGEKLSSIKTDLRILIRQAEKQICRAAEKGNVPYFNKNFPAWQSQFWDGISRAFQSGVQIDPPRAMSKLQDHSEQLENLFDAVVAPSRAKKQTKSRADWRLTNADSNDGDDSGRGH